MRRKETSTLQVSRQAEGGRRDVSADAEGERDGAGTEAYVDAFHGQQSRPTLQVSRQAEGIREAARHRSFKHNDSSRQFEKAV